MTATLGADHKIALSADVVAQGHFTDGMQFRVSVTPMGALILRPSRPRHKTLVDHLRGLQGLEITRDRDNLRSPVDL